MRRRVKEQLKRIGGMEFWNTNFSFIDQKTQEEKYVLVPEEREGSLIESTPIKPGVGYTVSEYEGQLTLVQNEAVTASGNGKLNISGNNKSKVKQNIKNVYQYIRANETQLLPSNKSLNNFDVTIQLTPLIGSEIGTGIGASILLSILTSMHKKSSRTALGVLGDVSVGGGVQRVSKFSDAVAMLSDNGAKTVLVPVTNTKDMADLPQSLLTKTDVMFYPDSQKLLQKGIVEG